FKKGVKPVAVLHFGHRERKSVAVERLVGKDSTLALVPEEVLEQVRKGPLAYLDRTLPTFNPVGRATEDVTRLAVRREGTTYELKRDKTGSGWTFTAPKSLAGRTANAVAVEDVLHDLNSLHALEVVAEKATPGELDKVYNLKDPPYRAVVTVTKKGK